VTVRQKVQIGAEIDQQDDSGGTSLLVQRFSEFLVNSIVRTGKDQASDGRSLTSFSDAL
jgi:hypothetical protein